jgi:hypothetical protein
MIGGRGCAGIELKVSPGMFAACGKADCENVSWAADGMSGRNS